MLGEIIHGYRVDRSLAADKGGFGDVYFATHVESGAEAVVKVLKPEMSAQREIVARFFNEARAAASVHHPGIVQIHNMGYHRDRAYLLMERLRGDDLETRLAHGPLPAERAALFVRQAAGAIGAAHDRGIVHRDLKPANLFAVPDPDVVGGERVKVLDFGIAKLTDGAGGGKTQGVFGTPSYMSPEQCASAAAVDGRSDLYALGCIFYELVCGRPPFGHGGLELIAAHLRDVPPPPRAIAPWVPPAIEQVILRLLEKQPGQRYPSCAALIAAIDEAVRASGLPAVSSPQLPAASASMPAMHDPRAGYAGSPSTLGGAAAAVMSPAAPRRGLGAWFGLGTVVIVGGAVAAVTVLGGGPKVAGPGTARSDAGVVAVVAVDAAAAVGAPVDAVAAAVVREDPSAVREEPVVAREEPAVVPRRERVEPAKDPTDRKRTIERTGGTLAGARVAAQDPAGPAAQTTPPSTDPPASTSSSVRDVATTSAPAPAKLDPADEAQALNEQGKTDMLAKRYDEASAAFRKAYALAPRGQYLLNIAVSEIQRGDCRAAKDDLLLLRKRWPDFSPDKVDRLMVKADSCR